MQAPLRSSLIGVLLALGLSGVAHADTFVLAPLQGRNPTACSNVTELLSAELDFQPMVSNVVEGKTKPSGTSCLSSTSCLSALMHASGGQSLVTGVLTTTSKTYTMDLVYYDGQHIVRRHSYSLGADPTALADGMTGVVRSLLLGKSPTQEKAAQPQASDFSLSSPSSPSSGKDDFHFDDSSAGGSKKVASDNGPRRKPETAAQEKAQDDAQQVAELEAQQQADERSRRRQEASRHAAAERRQHDDQVAKEKAASESESKTKKDPSPAKFDPNAITFASAGANDIKIEPDSQPDTRSDAVASVDDDGAGLDDPSSSHGSASSSHARSRDKIQDLDDGPGAKSKAQKPKKDKKAKEKHQRMPSGEGDAPAHTPKPSSNARHLVTVVGHGGYSPYYSLGFLTYGAEVGVPIGQTGLYADAGLSVWSVHRVLPASIAQQVGQSRAWDSIFPFNLGASYKLDHGGSVVPYAGADLIIVQYYLDKTQGKSYWAVGPRAHLGVDVYLSKLFGLTVDGSLGVWGGKQWQIIDSGVKNAGVLPALSAGAVFRL